MKVFPTQKTGFPNNLYRSGFSVIGYVIIILIPLLFSCNGKNSSSQNPDRETGLTVMTYNIHHGRGMDGELDLDRIAQVIRDEGADIVALQEVDMGVERSGGIDIATELSERTGLEYYVFGKNLDHQGGEYGNATLSKYPITESENIHFEQLGSEQRGVLTTVVDVDEYTLLVLNTHLAHRREDEPERLLFVEKTRDELLPKYQSDGVIFLGDFNDVPGSATHQTVKEYLNDAWEEAGQGEGFTIPPDHPNRRIDYIFYDGLLQPKSAHVPQTLASDHLPVVVEFDLSGPAE